MQNSGYNSRLADKFVVRFPDNVRQMVEQQALDSGRSMNSVMVEAIKEYLNGRQRKAALLDALEAALESAKAGQP
ncbi:Arc family DNA-binding protein [Pseudomonas typographi]|uniref:Arc family DNA-binding protein n=1 Tax=Pseudomonas typographi TaxID=2715964 RepID=A0ABR7Z6W1_9PSED|nr:Arc family DNA-binding protein [Pseudomonas typographi]MBD1601154.1 Arc family DNA-binding protein [Pseudomonas typographi]